MKIYWRVCEQQETLSFVPRWNDYNKIDIIKKCWISLQKSLEYDGQDDHEIVVVEDDCSQNTLDYLKETAKIKRLSFHHVKPHPILDDEYVKGKTGHFIEVAELIDQGTKSQPDKIHFMCNDDFLFLPTAIAVMESVFVGGWKGFVIPYDYPDRYTIDNTRLCEVYMGEYNHWRTVPSCTSITSAHGSTWQQYMRSFKRNAYFNDDSWTWEAYSPAKTKAICPIPGVATHLTKGCMTPYIDWNEVWENIDV